MTRVCKTCRDKMAWVPDWDHDAWRCKLCGTEPPVHAQTAGEQRIIELAQGFVSEEAATRDRVRSLFRTATPQVLNRILDAEAHTADAHRRELAVERRRGCIQIGVDVVQWLGQIVVTVFCIFLFRLRFEALFDLFTGSDPPELQTRSGPMLTGLDEAAREALGAANGVGFAGSVARAALDDRLRDVAMSKLPTMAGCFGSEATEASGGGAIGAFGREDAKRLTAAELAALPQLLHPDWAPSPPTEQVWDAVMAACHMLSFTECEPAVEPLHRLAESWWGLSRSVPARVRASARLAVEAIERRLDVIREQDTLLRAPKEPFPDTDSLLRPATAGEEPPEQLLRPTDADG